MKCQKCSKGATVHITEIVGGKVLELHFCEEHAKDYLKQSEGETATPGLTNLASALAEQLQVEQTAKELAELDSKTCPVCGITYSEFRNHQGRLGCPYDYVEFAEELESLLWNIHGADAHVGKKPQRAGGKDTFELTDVIRLKRQMHEAVQREDYEAASKIRDQVRIVEERWQTPPRP